MRKSATILILVILGCGPPPPPDHVTTSGLAISYNAIMDDVPEVPECPPPGGEASVEEIQDWTGTCISHAEEAAEHLLVAIDQGREIKDIIFIHCLNEKLLLIQNYLEKMQEIPDRISTTDDLPALVEEFSEYHMRVATIVEESRSCVDDTPVFSSQVHHKWGSQGYNRHNTTNRPTHIPALRWTNTDLRNTLP